MTRFTNPNPLFGGLQASATTSPIAKGSLVTFQYAFHKPGHDPNPLVLITDIWPAYIRGVNLHYLTPNYIKSLLQSNKDNRMFSYLNIKSNRYITSAFRQYKRQGIRGIRKFDTSFLTSVLSKIRSIDPHEVEAIRRSVREQIFQMMNPIAGQPPGNNVT